MRTIADLGPGRLEGFEARLAGEVLHSETAGYDEARRVHNGLVDRRPALIARCRSVGDIAEAVRFANAEGLEISVRGGGHNVAGRAVVDGGLMIDLSQMKAIEVDPQRRTVRVEGGVLWDELNNATGEHGLAVTGGAISLTGVAGLTLGGGLGWLMGRYGLAADNVIAVELVTAEGEVLDVRRDTLPDLFWALRGGGGNFGVAASFEFRLHPVAMVTGGLIAHPIEAGGDMLRFYRGATANASDELTVFAALAHAPDGSGAKIAGMIVCHCGSPEQAELELEPFKTWGSPLIAQVGPMPYPVMNTILNDAYPTGSFNYWLSAFTGGLSDGLIDAAEERFATVPSPMTVILFEHFHGEVTRVGVTDTAVPHRAPGWNLLIPAVWTDPADTDANIGWAKDSFAAFMPHFTGGRWLNYLGDDQGDDAVRAAYGPNYGRLVEVKRRYDPGNVFHQNHNIVP
jgi:FAD/FMN-containing dehydrogenase